MRSAEYASRYVLADESLKRTTIYCAYWPSFSFEESVPFCACAPETIKAKLIVRATIDDIKKLTAKHKRRYMTPPQLFASRNPMVHIKSATFKSHRVARACAPRPPAA